MFNSLKVSVTKRALVLMLVMSMILSCGMPMFTFAAESSTFLVTGESNKLSKVTLVVTNEKGAVVDPTTGTIKNGEYITATVSFGVPTEPGENVTPVKADDVAVFPLSNAFAPEGALPAAASMMAVVGEEVITLGELKYAYGKNMPAADYPGITLVDDCLYAILTFGDEILPSIEEGETQKYYDISGQFEIAMKYSGGGTVGGDGTSEVQILDTNYKVELTPGYTVTKSGSFGTDNEFYKQQQVEWTVKVDGNYSYDSIPKDGKPADASLDLKGYKLVDVLTDAGTYVDGTAVVKDVNGNVLTADTDYTLRVSDEGETLTVEFKEGVKTPVTLTYLTKIPDAMYYKAQPATNADKLTNTVELKNDDKVVDNSTAVVTMPENKWITKTGVSNVKSVNTDGKYTYVIENENGTDNSVWITWTVDINPNRLPMTNAVLHERLDKISNYSDLSCSYIEDTDGNGEFNEDATTVTLSACDVDAHQDPNTTDGGEPPKDVIDCYGIKLPDTSNRIQMTFKVKVPVSKIGKEPVYVAESYKNTATLVVKENGIKAENTVYIGPWIIDKKKPVYDLENHTATWDIRVNGYGQDGFGDIAVLDLIIYGNSKIDTTDTTKGAITIQDSSGTSVNDVKIIGDGLTFLEAFTAENNDTGGKYGQQFVGFSKKSTELVAQVYTVMQGDTAVADLVYVTGPEVEGNLTSIPTNAEQLFSITTKVTPELFLRKADKYGSGEIKNTAYLTNGGKHVAKDTEVFTIGRYMLMKDAYKVDASGTTTVAGAQANSYDYDNNQVTYRIHFNNRNLNVKTIDSDGKFVSGMTDFGGNGPEYIKVTDVLPAGWVVKSVKVFEGKAEDDVHPESTAVTKVPDAVDVSDKVLVKSSDERYYTTSVDDNGTEVKTDDVQTVVLNFKELNKPYLIEIVAGPKDESLKEYFSKSGTTTVTNKASFDIGGWGGQETTFKVDVVSKPVTKAAVGTALNNDGQIPWVVKYNPYDIKWSTTEAPKEVYIEDILPEGIAIPTVDGVVDLTKIKLTEMVMNPQGVLSVPTGATVITGDSLKNYVTYKYKNIGTNDVPKMAWVLTIILPDTNKAYQIEYVTDVITGTSGKVTNSVNLVGLGSAPIKSEGGFTLSSNSLSAVAKKYGGFNIVKTDEADEALPGATFGLYMADGETLLLTATSDANGKLRFGSLRVGSYVLKELSAPSGYVTSDATHTVEVSKTGLTIITKVDGETVTSIGSSVVVNDSVTIANYKEVGSLTVSKEVSGSGGSKSKEFDFTVALTREKTVQTETVDVPVAGNFAYQLVNTSTGKEIETGTLVFDADGEASFTLKDNQSIKILGIPADAEYTVTEDDYSSDGYRTDVSGTGTKDDSVREMSGSIKTVIEPEEVGAEEEIVIDQTVTFRNRRTSSGGGDPDPSPSPSTSPSTSPSPSPSTSPDPTPTPTPGTDPDPDPTPTPTPTPDIPHIPLPGPDPEDPDSPDEFILIDETGTPLGHYTKDEEGAYIDENGVPLADWHVPKTGDETPIILWSLMMLACVAGAVMLLLWKPKKKKVN